MEFIAIAIGIVLVSMLLSPNRVQLAANKGCLVFLCILFLIGLVVRAIGFAYIGLAVFVLFGVMMVSASIFMSRLRKKAQQAFQQQYSGRTEEVDAEVMDAEVHEGDVMEGEVREKKNKKGSARYAKVVEAEILDETPSKKKLR